MEKHGSWFKHVLDEHILAVEKHGSWFKYRHVKINGSPVSLTENSAVFRKTDFKKKSRIFKNPLIVLPFFLKSHFL